jgi:hypothetical protein
MKMATYQTSIIVGIFQDELQAKRAVDALRNSDFRYDQIGVAISSSSNATPDLQADLIKLGVPSEQASYYDSAYKSGKIVVSIRPDGRDDEVKNILRSNGASNYEDRSASNPSSEQVANNTPAPQQSDVDTAQAEEIQNITAPQDSHGDID